MIDEDITELTFSGRQNLTNLELLFIRGTNTKAYYNDTQPDINGLESLSTLRKLKSLTLNNLGVKKIDFLGALNKIEQVTINKNRIENLDSKFLPQSLIVLNLRENFINFVPDMSHLTSLQKLDLSHNMFNDISNFSGLESLKDLRISRATSSKDKITLDGLNVINTFSKLEILFIQGWNIDNAEFLSGLMHIKEINLRNNKLSDVIQLNALNSLKILDVMRNNITDLTPLAPLVLKNDLDLLGSPNPLRSCSPKTVKQIKAGIHCSDSFFSNTWNSIRRLFM